MGTELGTVKFKTRCDINETQTQCRTQSGKEAEPNMSQDLASLVKLSKYAVFLGLFIFFIVRVITAVEKLQNKAVGTSLSKQSSPLLLYPSISVCVMNKEVMRYMIDGRLYASEQAFINLMKNNEDSQTISLGSGPNLTEMVQEVSIFDSNGTMHAMSPVNISAQSRDLEISQHINLAKLH